MKMAAFCGSFFVSYETKKLHEDSFSQDFQVFYAIKISLRCIFYHCLVLS